MPHPSRQSAPNACVTHNRISVHSGGTTEHSPPTSCHPRRATSRISTVKSVLRRTAPHPFFPSCASVQSAATRPHPAEASRAGSHPRAAKVGPASELAAGFSLRDTFPALIAARSKRAGWPGRPVGVWRRVIDCRVRGSGSAAAPKSCCSLMFTHARGSGERRRQHRGCWEYWGVARS